jgi:hypothetical protein
LCSGAGLEGYNPNHQLLGYLVNTHVENFFMEGHWAFPTSAAEMQVMRQALQSSELDDALLSAAAGQLQYDLDDDYSQTNFVQRIADVAGSMSSLTLVVDPLPSMTNLQVAQAQQQFDAHDSTGEEFQVKAWAAWLCGHHVLVLWAMRPALVSLMPSAVVTYMSMCYSS